MRQKKTELLLALSEKSKESSIPLSELIARAMDEGLLDENLNPPPIMEMNAELSK